MKKTISSIIYLSLITAMVIMSSCKKNDKIKGCTDKDSDNYNAAAQVNDGTCTYSGAIVVWYDSTASAGLAVDGATALTFYLNGQIIGSSAASVFWRTAPDCGQNGSITETKDLGNVKTQAYSLSVKDQTGHEYWNAVVNFNAATCVQFQLLWSKRKK